MIEEFEPIREPEEEPLPLATITSVTIDPVGPFQVGGSFTVEVRGTPGAAVDVTVEISELPLAER